MISIDEHTSIGEDELSFTFSRSSGPGGQNVNKVSTRVTLHFDVAHSPSLTDEQRDRIMERLATRINREGVLRVISQRFRSQRANREAATERFVVLMQEALRVTPPRKRTRIPSVIVEKRLRDKRHRSRLKRERSRTVENE
ncbi:MAG: aminoacyl-tRNA hydrolase [bacterium]|nr:MAG: aminoacyl-tRNA hydrolase [bacterium]